MRLAVLTAALLCALAAPVSAQKVGKSPDLWATINVCDTPDHPNTIGIRGSMPGLGHRMRLWMRFQVQYLSKMDSKWHNATGQNADSKWQFVGTAAKRVIEYGQDFRFLPPDTAGDAHTLRGAVSFKWVRHGHVKKRLRRITTAGHRTLAGADPEGYSAAICDITAP